MRRHWRRGKNRTHDQIVVRADQHRTFTLTEGGNCGWPCLVLSGGRWCGSR